MRISPVFRWFSLTVVAGAAVLWWQERTTATALQNRFAALRRQEQRLPGLRAERARLNEQLLAATSRAAVAPAEPEPLRTAAAVAPPAFGVEEWTPAAAWRNEGQSTPQATIATLLWAATGGDLAAVKTVLEFDDATRAKARAWFDSLPPATRALFASPEDLVASVTSRGIPSTAAQLSWFHQVDTGHAIVGVLLTAPASATPRTAPIIQPAIGGAPPTLNEPNANRLAVLNLHLTPTGWRVLVPAAAIDRMAKVLRAPAGN